MSEWLLATSLCLATREANSNIKSPGKNQRFSKYSLILAEIERHVFSGICTVLYRIDSGNKASPNFTHLEVQ